MEQFSAKLKKNNIQKELIYLGLIIVWLVITKFLLKYEDPGSCFKLKPLLQSKLLLAGIVYLGRELLFPIYRKRDILKFSFLILLGLGLCFQGSLLEKPDLMYWLLRSSDLALWSFFISLVIEPLSMLFGYWFSLTETPVNNYNRLWNRVGEEMRSLGYWLLFLEAICYFYLVEFYIIDTVFYSYLMAGFLWFAAASYYSLFFSKTQQWVARQIALIDENLPGMAELIEEELSEENGKTAYRMRLIAVRQYLNSFKYPRLFVKNLILYLLFTAFLLGLPYFFGAIAEV